MSLRFACALALLLAAPPASGQWTQIDTNYGVNSPYRTDALDANDDALYTMVHVESVTPAEWRVFRSTDDGATWTDVRTVNTSSAVTGSTIAALDGAVIAAAPSEAGIAVDVHLSTDGGATWAAVTSIPTVGVSSFGRVGDTIVAVGFSGHRSTDAGATWQEVGGASQLLDLVRFAGAFWARSSAGALARLPDGGGAFESSFPAPTAGGPPASITHLWLADGRLWLRGRDSIFDPTFELYATDDGTTWTQQPAGRPNDYNLVYPAQGDDDPWFMTTEVSLSDEVHFLSTDDGASLTDITGNYPRDSNGGVCFSEYTTTATAAFGSTTGSLAGASGCTPGTDAQAGVYRYAFSGGSTASATGPEADGLALDVWPNPTNGTASVGLRLDAPARVTADLHDALGRHVARLGEGEHPTGIATFSVPSGLAPGVYVIRAVAGGRVATRSLAVTR